MASRGGLFQAQCSVPDGVLLGSGLAPRQHYFPVDDGYVGCHCFRLKFPPATSPSHDLPTFFPSIVPQDVQPLLPSAAAVFPRHQRGCVGVAVTIKITEDDRVVFIKKIDGAVVAYLILGAVKFQQPPNGLLHRKRIQRRD